jgi:DNA-binding MarR family transcriptional regulator
MAERHPDTDDKRLTLIFLIPKGNQLRRRYYLWSIKLLNMQALEPKTQIVKTFLQIYNN